MVNVKNMDIIEEYIENSREEILVTNFESLRRGWTRSYS
jgi:hypothetical protein